VVSDVSKDCIALVFLECTDTSGITRRNSGDHTSDCQQLCYVEYLRLQCSWTTSAVELAVPNFIKILIMISKMKLADCYSDIH